MMPKTFFGRETLVGMIVVEVGRVFCQDDYGDESQVKSCLRCKYSAVKHISIDQP